jgi:outer membrane protein
LGPSSSSAAPAITLDEAIRRAQTANSAFATVRASAGVAQAQKGIARAALLPGVTYNNQYLYTQGHVSPFELSTPTSNGTSQPSVRYIANNTVHEYISQAAITETIGGAAVSQLGAASANAAAANAQLEVARRGLVSTVVGDFYGVLAAGEKVSIAQRALDEADDFDTRTRQREAVGEVAHADVIKADLGVQQRQRDLTDAQLAAEKARINLGVFLFPDPTKPYAPAASLDQLPAMPSRAEIDSSAAGNPDLRAALATLRAANFDVRAARFAYLPDLSFSWFYGIDAPQFAATGPNQTHNLGYSGLATLNIPIWDWFSTQEKVKQSTYRREQARVDLTETQRQLLASLDELYREAEVAHDQLASLDQSVQSARDSLRLTRLRYTDGEGTVLEVVDAQNSLVLSETGRVDGAVRYFVALAGLQTLTGRMP